MLHAVEKCSSSKFTPVKYLEICALTQSELEIHLVALEKILDLCKSPDNWIRLPTSLSAESNEDVSNIIVQLRVMLSNDSRPIFSTCTEYRSMVLV